jgi:DNA polymerase-3 subunit delta'
VAERKAKEAVLDEPLTAPLGHEAVLAGLCAAVRASRLAHALEFVGPAGTGKFLAARWFAAALLCDRGPARGGALDAPCLECGACRRVQGGSHADLFVVDVRQEVEKERSEQLRIGRFIPRDEARRTYWQGPTVEDFLNLRAASGLWRIVIVREAERINVEAQNALLKSLEEPAPNVLWILETSEPHELLPTIHSRAVAVRFEPLELGLAARLLAEHGVDAADARELARWAGGAPGVGVELASQSALALRGVLLAALSGEALSTSASAALWAVEGEFAGKTERAEQRSRARRVLDTALELVRDRERLRAGADPAALAHGAHAELLSRSAALGPLRRSRDVLEILLRSRVDLDSNVDPQNVVERAVLALAPRAGEARSRAPGATHTSAAASTHASAAPPAARRRS